MTPWTLARRAPLSMGYPSSIGTVSARHFLTPHLDSLPLPTVGFGLHRVFYVSALDLLTNVLKGEKRNKGPVSLMFGIRLK